MSGRWIVLRHAVVLILSSYQESTVVLFTHPVVEMQCTVFRRNPVQLLPTARIQYDVYSTAPLSSTSALEHSSLATNTIVSDDPNTSVTHAFARRLKSRKNFRIDSAAWIRHPDSPLSATATPSYHTTNTTVHDDPEYFVQHLAGFAV